MTDLHEKPTADEGDAHSQDVFRSEVPAELSATIAFEFAEDDRERLANAAAKAAVTAVPEQYQGGPIGRNIAQAAARIALGLQPLPDEVQGEQ